MRTICATWMVRYAFRRPLDAGEGYGQMFPRQTKRTETGSGDLEVLIVIAE